MSVGRFSSLVAVLLCGAFIAGCGSSSSSGTTSSTATTTPAKTSTAAATTPTTPTTAPKSSTSTASTTSTPSLPTAAAVGAAGAAEYADICKSIIQRDPTLPGTTKSKLEGICAKAASGNLAGARAAAKQVCVEVVNASPLPAAEKAKTLAECKNS
jgi:hypothetical protein